MHVPALPVEAPQRRALCISGVTAGQTLMAWDFLNVSGPLSRARFLQKTGNQQNKGCSPALWPETRDSQGEGATGGGQARLTFLLAQESGRVGAPRGP